LGKLLVLHAAERQQIGGVRRARKLVHPRLIAVGVERQVGLASLAANRAMYPLVHLEGDAIACPVVVGVVGRNLMGVEEGDDRAIHGTIG